jgi:hypothetical protein
VARRIPRSRWVSSLSLFLAVRSRSIGLIISLNRIGTSRSGPSDAL